MTRGTTWLLVAALAATGAAAGWAVKEHREGERARRAIAVIASKRMVAEGRLRALEGMLAGASAAAAENAGAAGKAREAATAAAMRRGGERPMAAPEPEDPVARDPELQNLYLAAERAKLGSLYALLHRRLGLSGAQTEALHELLVWRDEQRMDLADVQESAADEAAFEALKRRVEDAFAAKVRGLLGDAAYLELVSYERMLPMVRLVSRFAGAVALEGQPLAPEQGAALVQALAQASRPYRNGGAADPNQVDWTAALPAAAQVLTPPQQRSFRNMAPRYPVEPWPAKSDPPTGGGG